jgi:hypothetical protein
VWERQRTLETTSALVIGSYSSATGSACIVFIALYEIQAVNMRLQKWKRTSTENP